MCHVLLALVVRWNDMRRRWRHHGRWGRMYIFGKVQFLGISQQTAAGWARSHACDISHSTPLNNAATNYPHCIPPKIGNKLLNFHESIDNGILACADLNRGVSWLVRVQRLLVSVRLHALVMCCNLQVPTTITRNFVWTLNAFKHSTRLDKMEPNTPAIQDECTEQKSQIACVCIDSGAESVHGQCPNNARARDQRLINIIFG